MRASDARLGQKVRWQTAYGPRVGQVYEVHIASGEITVDYFASIHGGWVRQEFKAEDLEPASEEA